MAACPPISPAKDPLVTCRILDSNYQNQLAPLPEFTKEEKVKQRAWMETELKKPRAPGRSPSATTRSTATARTAPGS